MTGLDTTQLPAAVELCSYLSFHWAVRSSNDPGLALVKWYLENFDAHLVWSVDDKTGRARKYERSGLLQFCEANVRGHFVPQGEWSSSRSFGAYGSKDKRGVSPWTLRAAFQNGAWGSNVLMTWPIASSPSWAELASKLRDAADPSLRMAHGGLTYAYSVFDPHDGPRRHAIVPRFWGVDPPEPNPDGYASIEGTRSPSWLTFVPSDKLETLEPATLDRLDPGITQTKVAGGTLFQLGPEPILGDQNRGEPMPLHRELARELKPIRGNGTHWINSTSYEYHTWVARFDAPETELTP